MKTCKVSNYSSEYYKKRLAFSDITSMNVDDGEFVDKASQYIISELKSLGFSSDINDSEDEAGYKDSINNLTNDVKDVLIETGIFNNKNINKLDKVLNRIKNEFLPKPLTKAEEFVALIIPGMALVRDSDIYNIRYNKMLVDVYGISNPGLDAWRLQRFQDQLSSATIINVDTEEIIDSNYQLNNNIIAYQNKQYKIIRNWLFKNVLTEKEIGSEFPKNLFIEGSNCPIKASLYYNTIMAMYNIILKLKKDGVFINKLENGWNNSIDKKRSEDRDLYEAVEAFINLVYFDNTLKLSVNNFIKINRQNNPIQTEIDEFSGNVEYKYKYEIAVGNTNSRKSWGDENQDSVKEMSDFGKFIIGQIPIFDYKSKLKQFGRLSAKDFIGTITKLKTIGSLVTDTDFLNATELLNNSTSINKGSLYTIFDKLFINKSQSVIDELRKLGFDYNNFNTLYSIYKTVYSAESKSWKSIETKYELKNGLQPRYSLTNTLFNLMLSNTELNYLQSVYDFETDNTETTIKEKYSISRTKFDIINDINKNTVSREDFSTINNKYKLTQEANKKDYTVRIGGINYKIESQDSYIILDKKNVSSNKFVINELNAVKDVELDSREKRSKIINGTDLTPVQERFRDVLVFIDDMLGMDFSKNPISLNEFYLASKGRPSFLNDVFMSAVRARVIQEIYNDFKKAKDKEGNSYSRNLLVKYLQDSDKKERRWSKLYTGKLSNYFKETLGSNDLTTVDTNEKWIVALSSTKALLANDTSKSTTSDLEGNKLPNFSPMFLSGEIKTQLNDANKDSGASSNLLFSGRDKKALEKVTVDSEVKTESGVVKKIKDASEAELFYHSIVEKFLIPFANEGKVYVLSTTQSDKTKFIANLINLDAISFENSKLIDLAKGNIDRLKNTFIKQYFNTVGKMYNNIYDNVIQDYQKLFPSIKTIDDINLLFKGKPVKINGSDNIYIIDSEQSLQKAIDDYNSLHPNENLIFYRDLHYRQIKDKKLAFNELLYEYSENLYNRNDSTAFKNRLKLEQQKYINGLLDAMFSILYTNQMQNILSTFQLKKDDWVSDIGGTKYVALAKVNNEKIFTGQIDFNSEDNIEINPMLLSYFYVDNLLGNNIRYSTTGSEINHKIKELSKLDLKKEILSKLKGYKTVLKLLNKNFDKENITFYDLKQLINKALDLLNKEPDNKKYLNLVIQLNDIYNTLIYRMENLGQNALFKRNVIMSATMNKIVPSLNGITKKMNVACIEDVPVGVFNFSGNKDNIDAHDGSALISPLQSNLENRSLGPNEVGTIKKPIQHYYNNKYATATLLKYATDTITNEWMRQSVGNNLNEDGHGIDLYEVFKKMHNFRWHLTDEYGRSITDSWTFGKVDLVKGCDFKKNGTINFYRDILNQNDLYYNKEYQEGKIGVHAKIVGFGIENGVYFTKEQEVDSLGGALGLEEKVYHYFDKNSNHIKSKELLENTNYHTIDSLYELHSALGGIWSESFDGFNFYYSETSNQALTNFANHVANLKEGADPNDLSIDSYDQPLKKALIHVLTNNSAIKNGAGNMNSKNKWRNKEPLSYITINSDLYGIQQDSDHIANNAQMTEFSLVISSLDAGGHMHDYVSQIYQCLGQVALELSQVEIDAVNSFKETGNISDLYDIVGRTIMANIKSGKGQIGLAEAIINGIKDKFDINTDHSFDLLKIPFSDPNIYSNILGTFVSTINKKSIKRLFPGLGTVMVPSFDLSMIYEIDGQPYQFEDVLKLAINSGKYSVEKDSTSARRDVVRQFLKEKQEQQPSVSAETFIPTDNVYITVRKNGVEQGNSLHVSLANIDDYYNFTINPEEFVRNKYNLQDENLVFEYKKDVTVTRNLAPARITYQYKTDDGVTHTTNIFNHWRIKTLFVGLNKIKNDLKQGLISGEQAEIAEKQLRKNCNVDKAFEELNNGYFETEDGLRVPIFNLQNKAAEIIMSNLYASKFGLRKGDSLLDVIRQKESYFDIDPILIESDNYDFIFTKGTGDNTFITFKPILKDDENITSFFLKWNNINKKQYNSTIQRTDESPRVINTIYAVTEDNQRLFEVGRQIVRDDVVYDKKNKVFLLNGKQIENRGRFQLDGDRVLETIYFVTKHQVNESTKDGASNSYTVYNINRNNFKRCFEKKLYSQQELKDTVNDKEITLTPEQKYNKDVNNYLGELLGNIYKADDYSGMQVNSTLSEQSYLTLKLLLPNFIELVDYDNHFTNYLKQVQELINKTPLKDGKRNINNRKLNNLLKNYNKIISLLRYTSFLKSQYFTAARIPAQTLQSFMQMQCVGFTLTQTGLCFVTAWLTWLLGSKINNN